MRVGVNLNCYTMKNVFFALVFILIGVSSFASTEDIENESDTLFSISTHINGVVFYNSSSVDGIKLYNDDDPDTNKSYFRQTVRLFPNTDAASTDIPGAIATTGVIANAIDKVGREGVISLEEGKSTVTELDQSYVLIPDQVKDAYLVYFIRSHFENFPKSQIIVFTPTCKLCQTLSTFLQSIKQMNIYLNKSKNSSQHTCNSIRFLRSICLAPCEFM